MPRTAPPAPSPSRARLLFTGLLAVLAAAIAAVGFATAGTPGGAAFSSISWSPAASQPQGNSEAQGEVVAGKLYTFGGFDSLKACCTPTARAYAFDPAEDTWTALAAMPGQKPDGASTAAAFPGGVTHAGFANDGRYVYWAGGYIANAAGTGQTFGTNEVWRYDTQAGTYVKLANLPKRTSAVQAEVVGGTLHVFGGTTADTRAADLNDHFTLALGATAGTGATWATRNDAAKLSARHHMGSTVVGTRIFAIGGQTGHDGGLTTRADVQAFDTANAAAGWQSLAPLPSARGHISNSTFTYGGRIFVMGGETANGAAIGDVSVYDPGTGAWSSSTALPAARVSGVGGAIGGRFVFSSGGGSAATYIGAPGNLPGSCADVSELACAQVKANLPLRLDFSGTEGGLYDAQGQDLGFTMVQRSSTGTYRPERLDVTGGTLRVRTTSGIQYRSPASGGTNANSLDNGLGVGVDATKPLRIETTVLQPALGTGQSEQPGIWFGPDQDNYVKVDLASTGTTPYHRPQIVWEVGGVPTEINVDVPGTNHSGADVKLIMETDPVTRIATGYLQVGSAGRVVIGQTTALPAAWFAGSAAAQGSGFAGLFATHRNRAAADGALTYRFADFGVTDLTPAPDTAPNMVVATTRVVLNDNTAAGTELTRKAITVANTGQSTLTLQAPTIADDPAEADDDAGQWSATNGQTTITPGGTGTVTVNLAATTVGLKSAFLTIRSDDPDGPTATVKLRGWGQPGLEGANEPSLQRVLDTWEIPVNAGDISPDTVGLDNYAPLKGDEVSAQAFERAGTGDITVEPLSQFSPSHDPHFIFGWHPAGAGAAANRVESFRIANDPASNRDHQTLDVAGGIRTINPTAAQFALYSVWEFAPAAPYAVSTEDAVNPSTWANRHKVRVYPMRTPAGIDVPNAYVVATDETNSTPGDYQDLVYVLRNVRPVTAVAKGEVDPENLDKVPFPDRLVMNRIQTPDATTPNVVHDRATVRLHNRSTTEPLTLKALAVDAGFELVSPPPMPRDIAPGAFQDVTVEFVATTPAGNPANRLFTGALSVSTSDGDESTLPIQLAGMWQRQSEGGTEPGLADIVRSYGYGTTITRTGQNINNQGRLEKVGDEVHSRYWKRASTTTPVVVRQLGAFHTQGNTASFYITRKGATGGANKLTHVGVDGQSFLPRKNDTGRTIGEASFTPTAAETGSTTGTDTNDGVFGLRIDPEYSDWSLNNQGPDACQATPTECGHHLRTWPAEDRTGKLIPNAWIVSMDYAGINYDFQDNTYLVTNIRPELDEDDPSTPKPCAPTACAAVAVDPPFALDFATARAATYADKDTQGTGFTWLLAPGTGTGHVPANLDLAASELALTTTAGLSVNAVNTQDNMLGVGIDWTAVSPARRQAITTKVLDVPATPTTGKFQQAGLWFGRDQDNLAKLQVYNGTGGYDIEFNVERDGALDTTLGVHSAPLALAGKDVDLKLVADPTTNTLRAYYTVEGGVETLLRTVTLPAAFFGADPAVTDPRLGTSSFAGLHASHRNGEGPLTYRFDGFAIGNDATQQRATINDITPANGATGVFRDQGVNMTLQIGGNSVDNTTIDEETLRLERVSDGERFEVVRGTSGGGDVLTMQPGGLLNANTQYRVVVTDGIKDLDGVPFVPFTSTFTTGATVRPAGGGSAAKFAKVVLPTATAPQYMGFTSLEMGPANDQVYALRNDGLIKRFPIQTGGQLGTPEELTGLRTYAQAKFGDPDRLATGLLVDPASTKAAPIVWVTHTTSGFADMADWGGEITRLTGANLQTATTFVVGLPRSARDHVTNSLRMKDGKLYFPQGSNSAMGEPDNGWSNRRERTLTGAILELDPSKVTSPPLNVKTPEPASVRTDGRDDPNLPDFCKSISGAPATKPGDPACTDPVVRTPGTYDPYAAGAALKIFATGIRNAYDLVWHSSGRLYTAANGSAAGGNVPATPAAGSRPSTCTSRIDGNPFSGALNGTSYTGGSAPGATNVETQHEWLFDLKQGGYYGHPNPRRCEWVLNGGNPTTGVDPGEVLKYPGGTVAPDPNYRGAAFDFGYNKSPNGMLEYKSDRFGGSLKGDLLVVRYSDFNDVVALDPNEADGKVPADGWQSLPGVNNLLDPLDVIEDADGGLYVAEYDQLGNGPKISYMRPDESGTTPVGCTPVSTLTCAQVKVGASHARSWEGATDAGGLKDADGQGTGFTMAQPNGADGTTAGHVPADIDVAGGRLTLNATQGIAYKNAANGGAGLFNQQQNALGVGLAGTRKTRLETTVVNPPFLTPAASEQGGLWFGPDQDNYVKLVVAMATNGGVSHHRVQLLREQSGASAPADEINVPAGTAAPSPVPNFSGTTVRLVLDVDPVAKTAEAFFAVGTGALQRVGELSLAEAKFFDASLLRAGERTAGIGNYGGVFATKRNNTGTAPVRFAFEAFSATEEAAANRAPVVAAIADKTTDEDSSVDTTVSATDPDGDVLEYSATGLPAGLTLNPATGRISGVLDPEAATQGAYDVVVTATDPSGLQGTASFAWTITPAPTPPDVDALKVDFTSPTGALAAGHVRDYGKAFGTRTAGEQGAAAVADLRYGWVRVDENGRTLTRFPLDLSVGGTTPGNGRERAATGAAAGIEARLRSFMHMQGDDVQAFEQARPTPGTFNGTPAEGAFEVALRDGVYDVTVAVGETNALDPAANAPERHFVRVEGTDALTEQWIPPNAAGAGRLKTVTVPRVPVTDGRLTLDAIGGVNTKIAFAEITRIVNAAPTVAPIADRSDRAGDAVELTVTGADADDDALTWSATGLPAGLAIDATTGRISGTIGAAAGRVAPYAVTVTATDDGTPAKTGSAEFAWTVLEAEAPTVTGVSPAADATEVALDANVTATFSEDVTITAAQFTLASGGVPVDAAFAYDAATRTATLDPTAPLAMDKTYTATVKGGADGVEDANGNPMAADRTWTFATVSTCGVHSELPCPRVDRELDHEIDFSGERTGTLAKTGGFTMSQPHGKTAPLVSSYKPNLLALDGGLLKVTTTIGIQYKNTANGGSADFNLLDNGLGIGFTQPTRTMRFETTVVPQVTANGTTASEQAGLWFGPDQDNYVKAVLVGQGAAGARTWRVQLAREVNGASAGPASGQLIGNDEVNQNLTATGTTPIQLRLDVDPRGAGRATASYRVGATGEWLPVGGTASLPVPAGILGGATLPAALRDAGTTQTAGLMATKRGRTATGDFVWAFDDWSAKVPNTAPVVDAIANQSDDTGATVALTTVKGTDPENDPITWSATGLPGTLAINPATGVISGKLPSTPGTADVTVTATSTGDKTGTRSFTWSYATPPAPAGIGEGLKVDFQNEAPIPEAGYVKDYGLPFGTRSGQRSGWVRVGTNSPLDLSVGGTTGPGNGRNRACPALSQKLRSPFHMQGNQIAGTFAGTAVEGAWELAVPDGVYRVKVGVGDPNSGADPEIDVVNAEGRKVVGPHPAPPATVPNCDPSRQSEGELTDVVVTDGRLTLDATGGTNTKITFVDITPVPNAAPVVTAPADATVGEGKPVDLVATADEPVTWEASGLPEGLAISATTGAITGSPAAGTVRTAPYVVTLTATDKGIPAKTATATFELVVADQDVPTVTAVSPVAGATGVAPSVTPTATFSEPIAAGTGSFRLYRGEDEVPGTTELSTDRTEATFTPAAALANATSYRAVVTGAEDEAGNALATPREWTFTTTNRAPALGNPGAQSAREGTAFTLALEATDPDAGQTVTYAATGLPAGLTIDTATGEISGTPGADTGRAAAYSVTVTASDSFAPPATDSETFALTVAEGTAPIVTGTTPAGGALGVAVGASPTATFSEPVKAASVAFTLKRGTTTVPVTFTMSPDRRTATLNPTAALDNAATYSAAVTAAEDDAGNALAADAAWSFTTANRAPQVSAPADATVRSGDEVSLDADATDADGHGVTFSATGLPAGLSIAAGTGAITGQTTVVGPAQITVRATDDFAADPASGTATFTLTVLETTAPVVQARTPADGAIGVAVATSPTVTFSEPVKAGSVSFTLKRGDTTVPSTVGLSGDRRTATLDPTGDLTNATTYAAAVTAAQDDAGNDLAAGSTWSFTTSNRTPSVTAPPSTTVRAGQAVSLDADATDPDGHGITFSATGLPSGIVIDAGTGAITGQTAVEGPASITIRATDAFAAEPKTGTATFTLTVLEAVAPTTSLTGGPAQGSTTTATSATLVFGADEAATFRCSLDGAAPATCTSPRTLTGLGVGEHTFAVRAVDTAGNEGNLVTRTWRVTAPTGTVSGDAPAGGTVTTSDDAPSSTDQVIAAIRTPNAGAVSIVERATTTGAPSGFTLLGREFAITAPSGSAAQPLRFEFRLDVSVLEGATTADLAIFRNGAAIPACTTADGSAAPDPCVTERTALPGGDVRIVVLGSEASTWNFGKAIPQDTTPPTASITGGPAQGSSSTSTTAAFAFASNEGGTFRCSLDGAAGTACTSPRSVTGLGVGGHTFTVIAIDAAGNESAPVTRSWSVTAPQTGTRPTVRVNMAGPAQTVGTTAWAACLTANLCGGGTMTGGYVYDNAFTVTNPVPPANARVYEEEWTGGQTNGIPVNGTAFTWNRDLPNGTYRVRLHFNEHNQRAAGRRRFDVNLEGGTKEITNLDLFVAAGGADRPYVRELTVDLQDGTLNVAFVRQLENALINGIEVIPVAAPAPDTTKPVAVITAGPAAGSSTSATNAEFRFDANESASFTCALDAGAATACTSPRVYSGLAAGQHTVTIRAIDAAGNVSDPVSRTWTVTAAPSDPRPAVRVNMAGPAQTVGSTTWAACTTAALCGGGTMTGGFVVDNNVTVAGPIAPANARIYREEWTGGQTNGVPVNGTAFTWSRPIANGRYRIRLHFNEHNQRAIGRRLFNVNAEGGTTELVDVDIYRDAGLDKPIVKEITTDVADGKLDLAFIRRVENAFVNGIEVLPVATTTTTQTAARTGSSAGATSEPAGSTAPAGALAGAAPAALPLRVDVAGAGGRIGAKAFRPCPVVRFCGGLLTGGSAYVLGAQPATKAGRRLAAPHRTAWIAAQPKGGRATGFTFAARVAKGRYRVRLHFVEPRFSAPGRRRFDVTVEGRRALRNFDIAKAAGGRDRPVVREVVVRVTDGVATVRFSSKSSRAIVSAIEILRAG